MIDKIRTNYPGHELLVSVYSFQLHIFPYLQYVASKKSLPFNKDEQTL